MISLQADHTLIDGALLPDIVVHIDGGRIQAVGSANCADADGVPTRRLRGKVLLPGFVNGHSHAFQRVLRGRTEYAPAGTGDDDFWSWREAMYEAATRLRPEQIGAVTRFAYAEMLRAGFTHVAEFHYLHHQPDGTPYDDPLELTRRVLSAADDAGIGITLLRVAYQRGGPAVGAAPRQRRFVDANPESYASSLEASIALADRAAQRPVHVGIAAHSVRALDRDWLDALHVLAGSDGLLHAHISEQPKEIQLCLAEHGLRPVQLLGEVGLLGPNFVGVHATHLDASEIALLGATRSIACICPTTERNLGDGLPPLRPLIDAGVTTAIGSDSHAVIDPFAEMAALENGERLRTGRRNVLVGGPNNEVARTLLDAGTLGGARACQLDAGAIREGLRADLVTVDIQSPQLAGLGAGQHGVSSLLAGLTLAGNASLVRDVWVGGRQVVDDGVHPGWESSLAAYTEVMLSLA